MSAYDEPEWLRGDPPNMKLNDVYGGDVYNGDQYSCAEIEHDKLVKRLNRIEEQSNRALMASLFAVGLVLGVTCGPMLFKPTS
jgi:hypothetical protein